MLIPVYILLQPAADFTIHEITHDDLYSKPSWFKDLNPAGLIPVIAWTPKAAGASGNAADTAAAAVVPAAACCAVPSAVSIKESLICNEYIEEAYPEPPVSAMFKCLKASKR
jgi:glutathione S-transferase